MPSHSTSELTPFQKLGKLTPLQESILLTLNEYGPSSCRTIADHLRKRTQAVGNSIGSLHEQGLVSISLADAHAYGADTVWTAVYG